MATKLTLEQLNNVAEIDVIYLTKPSCKTSERPQVKSAADAYEILLHYWDKNKLELLEEFKVLFMNRSNRVLQILSLSQGGITGTVVDIRILLAAALKVGAVNIIICHNHPSGAIIPSSADELLTMKIKEAAATHDIKLLDHLVITAETYFSFADSARF